MRKVYPSMLVRCPNCDLLAEPRDKWDGDDGSYLPAVRRSLPHDFEPRDGDRILWADDGCARCPDCGHQLDAEIGGWIRPLRWRCLGCGDPLDGRQVKWCNRKFGRWAKVCSIAWSNPAILAGELARQQQGLCGICLLPLGGRTPSGEWQLTEVDHVVPIAAGGERRLHNLRAAHQKCNQAKKARPLSEARIYLGLTDTEVLNRLARAEPATVALLKGASLDELLADPLLWRPIRKLHDRDRMALTAAG